MDIILFEWWMLSSSFFWFFVWLKRVSISSVIVSRVFFPATHYAHWTSENLAKKTMCLVLELDSRHLSWLWTVMSKLKPVAWPLDEHSTVEKSKNNIRLHGHVWIKADCMPARSLLESRIVLCVRKHTEKCKYRQKNIFLTVYPQKNTHGNITTEKFNCSVCSPSEIIFVWVLHAQKNCVSPD